MSWSEGTGHQGLGLEGYMFLFLALPFNLSFLAAMLFCHTASALEPANHRLNPLKLGAQINFSFMSLMASIWSQG